ncbi:ABC transporter substrate-binding protein [Micromonospora sp. Llam7]|uniref:ABC transporter substrate-binding protein n=1 Tax=Micromonospora tarapacensis TaxID=2835305 RepID=UPI001C82C222|nr:ABC transporter substrate-binding protein [Micromonospora tarapacensis]MBX7270076.1 ABC transporter substrate-binding protein [Micromonospora tarapacensis]
MDQISTESLLHLGLREALAGTAFRNDEIFPTVAGEYQQVKVLAEMYPSKEVLLSAEPDMIVGNIDFFTYSGFPPGTNFTRQELTDSGIKSYTLQCQGEKPDPERMFTRFVELASIFGVTAEAEKIVAEVKGSLEKTQAVLGSSQAVPTFVYRSGTGPLSTFGGGGGSDYGLGRAGGKNIFGDRAALPPPEVSVESVVDLNPQAILISDEDEQSPQDKEKFLRSVLAETGAVRNGRFCTIDFYAFGTPLRLARDANVVGKCLHPDLTFPTLP